MKIVGQCLCDECRSVNVPGSLKVCGTVSECSSVVARYRRRYRGCISEISAEIDFIGDAFTFVWISIVS